MKKVIIWIIVTVLIFGTSMGIGLRIYSINISDFKMESQEFVQGDWVELGGSFQTSASEKTEGYSVRLISAQLLPTKEFVERYGETMDYLPETRRPEFMIDIEVEFRNTNNTDGHIAMASYYMQTETDGYIPQIDLWNLANPSCQGNMGFMLLPNSQMTFHIPYLPRGEDNGTVFLKYDSFKLVVAQCPIKKTRPFSLEI